MLNFYLHSKLLYTLVAHKDASSVKDWGNYFYLSLPTVFFLL